MGASSNRLRRLSLESRREWFFGSRSISEAVARRPLTRPILSEKGTGRHSRKTISPLALLTVMSVHSEGCAPYMNERKDSRATLRSFPGGIQEKRYVPVSQPFLSPIIVTPAGLAYRIRPLRSIIRIAFSASSSREIGVGRESLLGAINDEDGFFFFMVRSTATGHLHRNRGYHPTILSP